MRITYFLTHPIQYQVPMIRHLVSHGVDLEVVYRSRDGVQAYFDPDFDMEIKWDLPLLEGYRHRFLEVNRRNPVRLLQACLRELDNTGAEVVWIHGWGTMFAQAAWLAAKLRRLPILMRGEAQIDSLKKSRWFRWCHRLALSVFFKSVDQFLAIGSANRDLYLRYGVPANRIGWMPYAVDNQFFVDQCAQASGRRSGTAKSLNLEQDRPVVLSVGKLIPEKSTDQLIRAFCLLLRNHQGLHRPYLLVVGDGPLRAQLETLVPDEFMDDVRFLGFRNQTELPALYDLCDVFVLASAVEPWGLVLNEVMNAGKPLIVSDAVGACKDLVRHGMNGYLFRHGEVVSLSKLIQLLCGDPQKCRLMGVESRKIINRWGFVADSNGLNQVLSHWGGARHIHADQTRHIGGDDPQTKHPPRIMLAYLGIHQIFQMAAAAAEIGELQQLFCSAFDGPGCWGRRMARHLYIPSARPAGSELIPLSKIVEFPWPLLVQRLAERMARGRKVDPLHTNSWFERHTANHMTFDGLQLVVGAETCSLKIFQHAKSRGLRCMLDCHGIPSQFLDQALQKAAGELGLAPPPRSDSAEMALHKIEERRLADIVVVCSELQKQILIEEGESVEKIRVTPLWIDTQFWRPAEQVRPRSKGKMNIICAGAISLAKGVPYLLKAIETFDPQRLNVTLVGRTDPKIAPLLRRTTSNVRVIPYLPKDELRTLYQNHDLLIMPSLGESFGFVALEAMACGLPVVVTSHCGVPVPQAGWRVPALSSTAIRERIVEYLDVPEKLGVDREVALGFAKKFTIARYKEQIQGIYAELLTCSNS